MPVACSCTTFVLTSCKVSAFDHAATPPLTLPLTRTPPGRAAAFALDYNVAVTSFHVLHNASRILVGGRRAKVLRYSQCTDLVLLSLTPPLRKQRQAQKFTTPVLGDEYTVQPSTSLDAPARLRLLRIGFEAVLASGTRVPMLVLSDEEQRISPGWSGAPVSCTTTGAVIGVVTQILDGGLVHAIPGYFLELLGRSKGGTAFQSFSFLPGITTQPLITPATRIAAHANSYSGVRIATASPAHALHVGDIMTCIDGEVISSTGTIDWHGVPATWQAAVCEKAPGSVIDVTVIRSGTQLTQSVMTQDVSCATGALAWTPKRFVVAGGALFSILSFELLRLWGTSWRRNAPRDLVDAALAERMPGVQEIVVLVGAAEDITDWDDFQFLRVVAVDGQPVLGLDDLVIDGAGNGEMIVEFANGFVAAVPRGKFEEVPNGGKKTLRKM